MHFPEMRMVLDEIKSIREKMDEVMLGQRQIQQRLGPEAFPPRSTTETASKKTAPSVGDEAIQNTSPSLHDVDTLNRLSNASQNSATEPFRQISKTSNSHERELRNVLAESQRLEDENQEVSEFLGKKVERFSTKDLSAKVNQRNWARNLAKAVTNLTGKKLELIFDSCIAFIIFANAIFVGISMDAENAETGGYLVIHIVFVIIFWAEVILKVHVHGWRQRYCCGVQERDSDETAVRNMPPRRTSCGNTLSQYFDLSLVVIDTIHVIISRTIGTGFSASFFRVVRLLRLARIVRLLRARVFRDLLNMIQGMLGGLGTLGWSLALFVLFVYVVALVFRYFLGPKDEDIDDTMATWYFRSVPRSMCMCFHPAYLRQLAELAIAS